MYTGWPHAPHRTLRTRFVDEWLADEARERLERAFPSGWEDALEEIAQSRAELRSQGAGALALAADARGRLLEHGLV